MIKFKHILKLHQKVFELLAIISVIILNIYGGVVFLQSKNMRAISQKTIAKILSKEILDTYAREVVKTCSTENYKPTCYEKEITQFMDVMSMEQAFDMTKIIQDYDPSYGYCHVLGHKLSAKETVKDPSKWKEIIGRCPSGVCSNGCIHGAFQERFRTEELTPEQLEVLKPELEDVCEAKGNWKPTGLEQATCYHALGHLLMYITGADATKSSSLCDEFAIRDGGQRNFSQVCYDGTFMQIFQPLEVEDFALIKGKEVDKQHHKQFCDQYSGWKQTSCWNEGWPLYREQILTSKGLTEFCDKMYLKDPNFKDRCFAGMSYVVTAQLQFDLKKVENFCKGLTDQRRSGQCFANAATRLFETDYRNIPKSVELCNGVQKALPNRICFEELLRYSTFNFKPNSPEFFQLCNLMPEPWKTSCLTKRQPEGGFWTPSD